MEPLGIFEISFNVTKATVLIRAGGTDIIMLEADLPSPFPAMQYDACFKMETAACHAVEYLKANFPNLRFHVIDTRGNVLKEYDV